MEQVAGEDKILDLNFKTLSINLRLVTKVLPIEGLDQNFSPRPLR